MKEVAELLNAMRAAGVISDYALFGLESASVSRGQVARLAARHGLTEAWRRFEARFLDE